MPAGKRILRLGLDETSIQCYSGKQFGCVFARAGTAARSLSQHLPKNKRRKCLTLITTVADDAVIQNALPMFLIGNFNAFLKRDMKSLRDAVGPRVELIRRGGFQCLCVGLCRRVFRQNSAWNNVDLFCYVIKRFHLVLKPMVEFLQPVLYMDSLPLHIALAVVKLLSKCHIWPCVIPPMTTGDLQVPDTHVFAPLKRVLRESCDHARAENGGDMSMSTYLRSVRVALDSVVFGRSWAAAFDHNGFGNLQCNLGAKLRPYMPAVAATSAPMLRDIELCCPRNRYAGAKILYDTFIVGGRSLSSTPRLVRNPRLRSKRTHRDVDEVSLHMISVGMNLRLCRNLAARVRRRRVCDGCEQLRRWTESVDGQTLLLRAMSRVGHDGARRNATPCWTVLIFGAACCAARTR